MIDKKVLDELSDESSYDHISLLLDNIRDDGTKINNTFNYEKQGINTIIKMLEYVSEYFYHYNGTLFTALTEMVDDNHLVMDDFKKVMLIKNMKILFDKFLIDIKQKKSEFGIVCHNKTIPTILSCILNVPLRKDKKLYKETPSGLTYDLFSKEDPYCIRFSEDLIKMLNGTPSVLMKRRINLVKVREELKEYAHSKGMDTDGVFALLPQK